MKGKALYDSVFSFFFVCACSFPLVFASDISTMLLIHLLEFIGYFWGLEHDGTHVISQLVV